MPRSFSRVGGRDFQIVVLSPLAVAPVCLGAADLQRHVPVRPGRRTRPVGTPPVRVQVSRKGEPERYTSGPSSTHRECACIYMKCGRSDRRIDIIAQVEFAEAHGLSAQDVLADYLERRIRHAPTEKSAKRAR